MDFITDKIIEILEKLPAEEPCLDYKQSPYKKNDIPEFLKDVISMLNTEQGIGKDKYIIIGVVDKTMYLKGIDKDEEEDLIDDNEWQNVIDNISPRPDVCTGRVKYDGKTFGWVYISKDNSDWVYEAKKTIILPSKDCVRERNIIAQGQAYTRKGTRKEVLMEEGRRHLLEMKLRQSITPKLDLIKAIDDRDVIVAMSLLGGWEEACEGDIKSVERISHIETNSFIDKIRILYENNPEHFRYSSGCWKVKNHKDLLLNNANHIYDQHIDLYFDIINEAIKEIDPKYDLSSYDRPFVDIKNMRKAYSKAMCHGLAETLAIIGNNVKAFVNCTPRRIVNRIYDFERQFFKAESWKNYATFSDEIQFFGEAYPNVFMDEIESLISRNNSAFCIFLKENEYGVVTTEYIYQLGYVLANIARLENYFSKAVNLLFLLANINPWFVDIIVQLVLPWYPQAVVSTRIMIGTIQGIAEKDDKLVWDVLMKLMPKATNTTFPIPAPDYLDVEVVKPEFDQKKYNEATIGYIRLANRLMGTDVERMCSMISVLDDVGVDIRDEILQKLKDNAEKLDEDDVATLWNSLQDFLNKHRKFSNAEWALNEEQLKPIEQLSKYLVPDDKILGAIRLFRRDQYSLISEPNNYIEEHEKLRKRQAQVIEEVYDQGGFSGLVDFVSMLECKRLAGICAGSFLNDIDINEVMRLSDDFDKNDFLDGIIKTIAFERIQNIIQNFSDKEKARIIAKYPITDECIKYVYSLNIKAQKVYWETTDADVLRIDDLSLLASIVKEFNENHRTDKSIELLHNIIILNDGNVSPDIVADTLNLNVQYQNSVMMEKYYIQRLISWLQNKGLSEKDMELIEWRYLVILREGESCSPIYLWKKLATDAAFFVEVISAIYKKGYADKLMVGDRTVVLKHCYELMYTWKLTPGFETGKINKEKLDNWVGKVRKLASENGVEENAMYYFGGSTFYAPADPDGFFVDRNVAKYLNDDEGKQIRSGYHTEAINSRGVHFVDTTGKAELDLENNYRAKARLADENGMFRFAETLRDIADFYLEEREQNMAR